jgi:co-chaperonin GroES (HSP10)
MKSINLLLHRVAVRPMSVDDWDDGRRRAKAMGLELAPIETTGADASRAKLSVDIGEVLQVGSTAFRDFGVDCPIKQGDVVCYVKGSGKLVKNPFTQEECIALNDEDIVSVLTKE